ncbi:MAG: HD-GYP domain-containing protein (c-di-GMP phosphodiesterase class II), partial [Sulfurimonas sp.]
QKLTALIQGAFLHDVGKIGISDSILLKPDKLTVDEFETMKRHVYLGKDIIKNSKQLEDAKDVVEYHHEKYDGSEYLKGLKGEEIPINARIYPIADVFDALTSKRPYKEPYSYEKTKSMMQELSGKHFDPKFLDTFFDIVPELYNDIKDKYSDDNIKRLLEEKIYNYVQ